MLYATGEIVLVVVGILIALQINNWNEQSRVRTFERAILKEIRDGLLEDRQKLSGNYEYITEAVGAIDLLLDDVPKNNQTIARLLGKVISFKRFVPRNSAFEVLKSKDLTVIANTRLRKDIVEYYDEISIIAIEGLADIELEFTQEWYPLLRTEFSEFKFDEYAMPKQPQSFVADTSNTVFLRLAQDNRQGSFSQIKNAIDKIDEILGQLEREALDHDNQL
jgi:hypothetical protein